MKKSIVAILACIYLVVSSGFALNVHYCMGKVASVDLFDKSSDKCGKCGMKNTGGCCSDEFKMVKLQDSHKLAELNYNFSIAAAIIPQVFSFIVDESACEESNLHASDYSPPDLNLPSRSILHCVFRC